MARHKIKMGFQNWYCYCFILISLSLYSQPGENSNWYFGTNAGLTFNSGLPVALTNGALITSEGVATISDVNGNLLFYTNGVTVFTKIHTVMNNGTGLFGDASSTQSSIIVQKPGSINIYYIFTSDDGAGPNGICYSIVDISLNAGLGAVTSKNILLYAPSCEKLCVVRHCNNIDSWVISHDWNTNVFRVWSVTNLMVGNVQAWTSIGVIPSGNTGSSFGQLKASSDGKKIAACYYGYPSSGLNKLQIYDFDNATGWLSNAQTLASDQGLYGCEFSPNNKLLYAATNGGLLLQFNLCSNPISRYVVDNPGPFLGSLQLAIDNKIYVSTNTTSLSVINNPNNVGSTCNYTHLSLSLLGRNSKFSLPNFASYYNKPDLILNQPQILTCTSFQFISPIIQQTCNPINYNILWNFGDNTTSNQLNPIHNYLIPGIYTVTFTISNGCMTDQVSINVTTNNSIFISQINHN